MRLFDALQDIYIQPINSYNHGCGADTKGLVLLFWCHDSNSSICNNHTKFFPS